MTRLLCSSNALPRLAVQPALACCVAAFLTIWASGCAYNQGELVRRDVESIYIPIFKNESFDRGIEFELSRALIDEVQRKTSLRIVSDRRRAQTELTGAIFGFDRTVLSETVADRVREQQIAVRLRFTWTDLERQQVLLNEPFFQAVASARIQLGETEADAAQEALRLIAQRMVERLESSW